MKYRFMMILSILVGFSNISFADNPKSCLDRIDSIARVQTFREAIPIAELCIEDNLKDTRLNLRLAELYMLSYLVDNEENGLKKATEQFSKILSIDSSFTTNSADFNLDKIILMELAEIWFKIQNDDYRFERESILIWALIEDFDSEKEPKLIK